MLKKNAANFLFSFLFLLGAAGCDSRKKSDALNDPIAHFLCYAYNICAEPSRGVHFGLIGDSWMDLGAGIPIVWSIRTYMDNMYGFNFVGSSLGGRVIEEVTLFRLHHSLIDSAGPEIRYMVLSLGGNNLLNNYPMYSASQPKEKAVLLNYIKTQLLYMVRSGNLYKRQKWGGADLIWIIHGYDYMNPDAILIPGGCRAKYYLLGYPDSAIIPDLADSIDKFNEMLLAATYEEPSLRYVDLRGILGGPSVSSRKYMLDCIHPNSQGFNLITAGFVLNLDLITNNAR